MYCPYCNENIGVSPQGAKASTAAYQVPIVIVSCQYCHKVLGIVPDPNASK